jgi:hypothetical protein
MAVDAAGRQATPAHRSGERLIQLGIVVLAVTSLVVGVAMSIGAVGRPGGVSTTPLGEIGTLVFGLTITGLGVVLRSRRPEHPMGWLFLAFGLVIGISAVVWATMVVASLPGGDPRLGAWVAWIGASCLGPAWIFLLASFIARFPTGYPESRFEARLLRWAVVAGLVAGATTALRPGPLLVYTAFDNPISTPESLHPFLIGASSLALIATLVPGALATVAIIRRYGRCGPIERLQLRWFAFGTSLVIGASVVYIVVGVIVAPDNALVREFTYALFAFALCSLPIAVFRAITSHRLYEIDRIISRTVAYGLLTAVLAGLYTASVRLFNTLFVALTGESNEAALVLTTLVLATTFTPIKKQLETLAAKRFDPGAELRAAAAGLTPEQQAGVEEIARRVALETMAATAVAEPSTSVGRRSAKPSPR